MQGGVHSDDRILIVVGRQWIRGGHSENVQERETSNDTQEQPSGRQCSWDRHAATLWASVKQGH